MPLAHKIPTQTGSGLPDSLKSQISNNFRRDENLAEPDTTSQLSSDSTPTAKSKYADSVNLRLTSGKRSEFKKFFTGCEISMNQGFEMAVDYIIREAKAGRITVSKSGIAKTGEL